MPLVSGPNSPEQPKVSVAMITYNHEKFIAQAIESVLMQETTFPIELVIGEDCSRDNTREIVKQFAARRPDIIRAILHQNNIGGYRNFEAVLKACRGQYVACLEGDDYWSSSNKLQRQVDFLDLHPEYAISGHRMLLVDEDHPERSAYPSPIEKESGTFEDVLRRNYLPTCSVVWRTGLLKMLPYWISELHQSDWPVWVCMAQHGRIGFLNEVMATYRVHSGGVWTGLSAKQRLEAMVKATRTIHSHFGSRYHHIRQQTLHDIHLAVARQFLGAGCLWQARACLAKAMLFAPATFLGSRDARGQAADVLQPRLLLTGLKHGIRFLQRGMQRAHRLLRHIRGSLTTCLMCL